MRRRDFITVVAGVAAWPLAARAQSSPTSLRVGTASPTPRHGNTSILVPFEQRMAELGYVDGKNFTLDYIGISGSETYDSAMHTLVQRNADVLLAYGPAAPLKAAIAVTRTIPIVMVAIDYDPLALGYVSSLARPTGNVTGLVFEQIELAAKRIELLKAAFPSTHGATVFWDALSADQWKATQASAERNALEVTGVELRNFPYDYEQALTQAPVAHRNFLIVMTSPYFAQDREKLTQFTLHRRIASMFVFREYVDLGGLMCYGPSRTVLARRAADYVNRIARGAKPSDLPIEAPTTFELVINLKTAKLLGLEFSQAMLLRADEVIE